MISQLKLKKQGEPCGLRSCSTYQGFLEKIFGDQKNRIDHQEIQDDHGDLQVSLESLVHVT